VLFFENCFIKNLLRLRYVPSLFAFKYGRVSVSRDSFVIQQIHVIDDRVLKKVNRIQSDSSHSECPRGLIVAEIRLLLIAHTMILVL